jgi:hypothetical protein
MGERTQKLVRLRARTRHDLLVFVNREVERPLNRALRRCSQLRKLRTFAQFYCTFLEGKLSRA